MFKYITISSGLILSVLMALFAVPVLAATPTTGVLNSLSKVRDSAGYTKVVVVLAEKTKIAITGEKGDWYQITRTNGSKGWILKELVDVKFATSSAEIIPKKATTVQNLSKISSSTKSAILKYNAKLRKTPKITDNNVIKLLLGGSSVNVVVTKDDWSEVVYGPNTTGWVSSELLTITKIDKDVVISAPIKTSTSSPVIKKILDVRLSSVTVDDINKYWQEKVNILRNEKDLRKLAVDTGLEKTAAEWATYMGENNKLTHVRPGGESMLAWADSKELEFTKRNSSGGWRNNYFTENIGLRLNVESTLAGVHSAMDAVLHSYLAEGPTGVHYRGIYNYDWNSVGVGWYVVPNANNKYKVYFVFHYGSLVAHK